MQHNTIVYFGIIQYEYSNAMCQHSEGINMLIKAAGFNAVTIGVSPSVSRGSMKKVDDNTYVVNDPQNVLDRAIECVSAKDIVRVMYDIGLERIKAFIMADFRYLPMKSMNKFCKKYGIHFVIDVMDRFVANNDIFGKIKKVDCDFRMKYLYPKIARRIYICRSYNSFIGEGEHTAVIPGVTWTNYLPEKRDEGDDRIGLVFLGQPGIKSEKEKIDWVVRAIYERKLSDRFIVYLAGFDKRQFLDNNPEMEKYITDNIQILGRIKHEECLELLRMADFSMIIRSDTILSKFGFSTKIGEAFSCGTPVLVTDTSDNSMYIENGKNGYICGCSYEDVASMLDAVSKLTISERYELKKHIYYNNPLDYRNYLNQFIKVVIKE